LVTDFRDHGARFQQSFRSRRNPSSRGAFFGNYPEVSLTMDHDTAATKVLIIGLGDLSQRLLHMLLDEDGAPLVVVVAGRSAERALRFANLARYTAANLGFFASVDSVEIDLEEVDRTAETLARIRPDIVVNGASLQAARAILDLPAEVFRELDKAQLGPWLPMHLALNHHLMRALRLAGSAAIAVNTAYPDAVGPALATIGLAPHIGVGNVGNIVPALTCAAALELGRDPADLVVRVVAHHYFSHHVHRFGEADGVPFAIEVSDAATGEILAPLPERMFARLTGPLKREGGTRGQQLTSASAMQVIRALRSEQERQVHAPAPHGRTGGYPLAVSSNGIRLDLPTGLTEQAAVAINEDCQRIDGIDSIHPGGRIVFAKENMSIMQRMLNYECPEMVVEDSLPLARELSAKYGEFAARYSQSG
jgi:NAD(P)-dependent dehydrogenase (short-subunit alcohol dehydrogenase family)